MLFLIPFGSILTTIISLINPGYLDIKLRIDENLSNYFLALEEDDKNWMVLEESNLRKNYVNFQINDSFRG